MRALALIIFFMATLHSSAQLTPEQLDTCKVYSSLEKALAAGTPVYRLDLTKQKIKELPAELYELKDLHELILDRNKLKEIPVDINKLQQLQRLSISKNELKSFPPAICNLRNLTRLDLSDNLIDEIPDEIHRLYKLEELILWSNVIGYYPTTLMRLDNLKVLDLLHNEMSDTEQERLKNLLPEIDLKLSPPCDCTFDDDYDDE